MLNVCKYSFKMSHKLWGPWSNNVATDFTTGIIIHHCCKTLADWNAGTILLLGVLLPQKKKKILTFNLCFWLFSFFFKIKVRFNWLINFCVIEGMIWHCLLSFLSFKWHKHWHAGYIFLGSKELSVKSPWIKSWIGIHTLGFLWALYIGWTIQNLQVLFFFKMWSC